MKTLKFIAVCFIILMTNIFAQPFSPADYFPLHIGNYWKYSTVHDTANPSNNRWSAIEVVDTTTFGIPGETISFKVEYSEWFTGQDTSIYRTQFYSFNSTGDLGYTGILIGANLTLYDSLIVFLRNPLIPGDTTTLIGNFYFAIYNVVNIVDTINLALGDFTNCLRLHEYSVINGQPNEEADDYFIPISFLPTAGVGKRHRTHWYSYPDSVIYGYSRLVECNVQPYEPPSRINKKLKSFIKNFRLYQNYPNPFNPATAIEFKISNSEYVVLKIYNILGEEVKTLVSGELLKGNHKYEFDGSDLASGVYYYRIEAGEFVETKKMMLLR